MGTRATRWIVRRNCSASPAQLAVAFGSVAALSFLIGVVFALHGLWLVLPFVGIEVAAIAAAFFCYARHAADFERIDLADGCLYIEHVQGGATRRWTFDLPWVGVRVEDAGLAGCARVMLEARGRSVEVGRHLDPERRRALADELAQALRAAALAARLHPTP